MRFIYSYLFAAITANLIAASPVLQSQTVAVKKENAKTFCQRFHKACVSTVQKKYNEDPTKAVCKRFSKTEFIVYCKYHNHSYRKAVLGHMKVVHSTSTMKVHRGTLTTGDGNLVTTVTGISTSFNVTATQTTALSTTTQNNGTTIPATVTSTSTAYGNTTTATSGTFTPVTTVVATVTVPGPAKAQRALEKRGNEESGEFQVTLNDLPAQNRVRGKFCTQFKKSCTAQCKEEEEDETVLPKTEKCSPASVVVKKATKAKKGKHGKEDTPAKPAETEPGFTLHCECKNEKDVTSMAFKHMFHKDVVKTISSYLSTITTPDTPTATVFVANSTTIIPTTQVSTTKSVVTAFISSNIPSITTTLTTLSTNNTLTTTVPATTATNTSTVSTTTTVTSSSS